MWIKWPILSGCKLGGSTLTSDLYNLYSFKLITLDIIPCRYLRLILQYSDVIVGQFYGHQNTDTFRVFYNNKRKTFSSRQFPGDK